MPATFTEVIEDIYNYPATPIWSSDDVRLGRRYRIVAPSRPDYVYIPAEDTMGYTSLNTASRCRLYTDVEAFRREVARLYIAGANSPSPDAITAFPDASISEQERETLTRAARAALETIPAESKESALHEQLKQLATSDTTDVKTLVSATGSIMDAWDTYHEHYEQQAGTIAGIFPSAQIHDELERRLWEREPKSLVRLIEPAIETE